MRPELKAPALGAMLVERKLLAEAEVQAILGEQEDLGKHEGELILHDEDARTLNEKFSREKMIIALGREGHSLRVAVVDPTNPLLQEEIGHMAGVPVIITVGTHFAVMGALDRIYGAGRGA